MVHMVHIVSNWLIDFLFLDTCGLIWMFWILRWLRIRTQYQVLDVMREPRRWMLVVFPWLILLLFLETPTRRIYRNARHYQMCWALFGLSVLGVVVWGALTSNTDVLNWCVLVCLWAFLLDRLVRGDDDKGDDDKGDDDKGDDDKGDDDHPDAQPPDDPTPTGDATERWLVSRQRQLVLVGSSLYLASFVRNSRAVSASGISLCPECHYVERGWQSCLVSSLKSKRKGISQ